MYQDIRFLNKEERRQFLISSVSERDWKREHRLELLIVSIFQMQVKFSKVCSPFCSTAGTVSKKIPMGGTQNFLQDVKRNINALCVICGWHGRVTESAQENQLTQDLELLMQVMDSRLQSLAKLNSDFHYQGNTEESSTLKYYFAEFTVIYSRQEPIKFDGLLLSKGQVMLKTLLAGPGT